MLCEKDGCRNEATYVVPGNWCEHHWAEWWVEGELESVKMTPEQKATAVSMFEAALAARHDGGIDERLLDLYDEYTFRFIGLVLMGPRTKEGEWSVEPVG